MLQAGMDYEAGMDEVAAISGATGTEIDALGAKAMEMAAKTKFSTAESAEAYKYMAMAGWKTTDMLNSLDAVMYLAGASGESLGATSDIVTDAMTAFGLSADGTSKVLKDGYMVEVANAQRFTDVLAAASNNANTNVSMLGESFKYVAPVAGAMGYSIEDAAIAMGLMANTGVKASMSGTSLRSILTNLSKPTKDMADAMYKLGVSMVDEDGKMMSLLDIMKELRSAFAGSQIDMDSYQFHMEQYNKMLEEGTLSEEEYGLALDRLSVSLLGVEDAEKASYAATIAGKYGMAGFLSIVAASDEDFNDLTKAIYNSNGATEEMYGIMTDNAQGAVTMLDSAINVLYTTLSQHIIPTFTEIVRKITDVVNWFGQLDDGTQKLILTIGGIAIAAGPVITVIGNIITAVGTIGGAIGGLIGIIGKVGTAVSGLFSILAANPIAIVIAAVAALVAGLIVLWNTNEDFRNAVGAIWDAITGFFKAAVDTILSAWSGVKEFFAGVWQGIQDVFSTVTEVLSGFFQAAADAVQAAWGAVVDFFKSVWDGIQAVFSVVADVLSGFFSAAWEAIKSVWDGVSEFFRGVWDSIRAVFEVVADVLSGFFKAALEAIQSAWSAAVEFFSGVWSGIQGVFSTVAEVLGGFFKAAWEAVKGAWEAAKEFFGGIAEGIHSAFEAVAQFLGDTFRAAWEAVQSAWEGAKEFFSGVWSAVQETASSAAEAVGNALKGAWDAVKSAWDAAGDFFKGIFDKIVGVFKDIGGKFKEIGGNIVSGLKDGVMGAWDAFTNFISGKIKGIVDGVKGLLGIHSPSKVFAGIGENMALGLGVGWEDEYDGIKRKIESGLDFGTATVGVTSVGTNNYGGRPAGGENPPGGFGAVNNFNFTFNSPEALDPVAAARESKKAAQQMALGYV